MNPSEIDTIKNLYKKCFDCQRIHLKNADCLKDGKWYSFSCFRDNGTHYLHLNATWEEVLFAYDYDKRHKIKHWFNR